MSVLGIMVVLAGLMLMALVMLRLQHYYWTQHRLVELRLDAIHDLNWLLAQHLTNRIADPAYAPGNDFLHSWNAAAAKARTLFSGRALQELEQLQAHVRQTPSPTADKEQVGIRQFIEMQDSALRALYREAGFRPPT